jgi:hypothetical protein
MAEIAIEEDTFDLPREISTVSLATKIAIAKNNPKKTHRQSPKDKTP